MFSTRLLPACRMGRNLKRGARRLRQHLISKTEIYARRHSIKLLSCARTRLFEPVALREAVWRQFSLTRPFTTPRRQIFDAPRPSARRPDQPV